MDGSRLAPPVERLLRPRSVAIVGASDDLHSIGGLVLDNLLRIGFGGAVHLVSRSRAEIRGLACVAGIDDLPLGIDTVALVVPAAALPEAVAACVRRSAGAAVAFASGFGEAGAAGLLLQEQMAETARSAGLALCGPNCVGFANFVDGVALAFEVHAPQPDGTGVGVALIAQSGAISLSVQAGLAARGLRLTYAVSSGNEAALTAEDYLSFMLADAQTSVVVMFLEMVRRPARFRTLAAEARARGKTIVLMHPGRTAGAQEAALSHTGALAGDHAVMEAVLAHEAVVIARTLDELFDVAVLLACCPARPVLGPAIVSNSGAFCGVALDLAGDLGLELPVLGAATCNALQAIYPAQERFANPFDTSTVAFGRPSIFGDVTAIMLADPAIGSVVLAVVPGPPALQVAKSEHVLPAARASGKPVVLVMMGDDAPLTPAFLQAMRGSGVPLFRSPDRAVRAVALLIAHGRALAACRDEASLPTVDAQPGSAAPIPEYRGKARLAEAGIAVPSGGLARTRDEAVALAERIGWPVVLKAQSAVMMHKTEHGGVLLNLGDTDAVRAGWTHMMDRIAASQPGLVLDGVLVEAMVPRGVELIVAARRDPNWGTVIVAGLGGIWTEALDDVRLMPPGLPEAAILSELGRLRGAPLLSGMRGGSPADMVAVAAVIATLGRLMQDDPAIVEIEINPLVAGPPGQGATALDALVVLANRYDGGSHA